MGTPTDERPAEPTLPAAVRRVHRALIDAVLATGAVPPTGQLAAGLGLGADALGDHLRTLQGADYLCLDAAGRLACLYPVSPVPTPHVVDIGGARRFAMCSIDALGMAAMLGREVTIDSGCAVCGIAIRIVVAPGRIVGAVPAGAVVVARRDSDAPAYGACCPFTLFACTPAHGEAAAARQPDTAVLSLDEGLVAGETIFGGFLGPELPARRRRSPGPEPTARP
jgi:alkylmercury lyase